MTGSTRNEMKLNHAVTTSLTGQGRWLVTVALLCLVAGCGGGDKAPGPVVMDEAEQEQWEIALVEMRIEKNEALMDSTRTSLPLADLVSFEGLNYYYPEPSLRFRVPFEAESSADTVILEKKKGQLVPYLRKGRVSFTADGKTHSLSVFGPTDPAQGDYLWLPFYDATNESETYPGGRYLDLKVEADDMVELDFNYAYNPLCDYNPTKYNCTLPPQENNLPFAVRAGEKRYQLTE